VRSSASRVAPSSAVKVAAPRALAPPRGSSWAVTGSRAMAGAARASSTQSTSKAGVSE